MKSSDYIDDSVSYTIGDGIITYYKNGLYYKHKFIESNDNSRKIHQKRVSGTCPGRPPTVSDCGMNIIVHSTCSGDSFRVFAIDPFIMTQGGA